MLRERDKHRLYAAVQVARAKMEYPHQLSRHEVAVERNEPRSQVPAIEALDGAGPGGLSQSRSKGRIRRQPCDARRKVARVAGTQREGRHPIFNDFSGPARLDGDDRTATRHRLRDDEAKGLRFGTGVHDDIQSTHGAGRLFDETGESDARGNPQVARQPT